MSFTVIARTILYVCFNASPVLHKRRSYTQHHPRKTGQNVIIEQKLVFKSCKITKKKEKKEHAKDINSSSPSLLISG